AQVSMWPADGSGTTAVARGTSNGRGEWRVDGLHVERYRVLAEHAGFAQREMVVDASAGAADLLLEMTPSGGLTLEVVDGRDGHRLDAYVVVRDTSRRVVATRGETGPDGLLSVAVAD